MAQLIYIKQTQGNGNGEAGKNLGLAPTQKDNLAMNFNNFVSKYHKQLNDVQPIMPEANTAPVVPDITPVVDNVGPVTPSVVNTNPVNDTLVDSPVITPPNNDAINDANNVIEPFAPNSPSIDSVINPTVTPVNNEVAGSVAPSEPVVTPLTNDNPVNDGTPALSDAAVNVSPVNTGVVDNVENTVGGPEIIPTVQETEIDLLLKAIEQEQAQLLLNIQDMITQHNKKIKDLLMSTGSKINENLAQAQEYKKQAEGFVKDAQAAAQVADIARQNAMNLQKENTDATSVIG